MTARILLVSASALLLSGVWAAVAVVRTGPPAHQTLGNPVTIPDLPVRSRPPASPSVDRLGLQTLFAAQGGREQAGSSPQSGGREEFVLVGVIFGDRPAALVRHLGAGRSSRLMEIGDTLGLWTLSRLYTDSVVIESSLGEKVVLQLPGGEG